MALMVLSTVTLNLKGPGHCWRQRQHRDGWRAASAAPGWPNARTVTRHSDNDLPTGKASESESRVAGGSD